MRLIDADRFRAWLLTESRLSKNYTIMMLDEQFTIDPVKHGRWVLKKQSSGVSYKCCSECGRRAGAVMDKYCSRCGARMDADAT